MPGCEGVITYIVIYEEFVSPPGNPVQHSYPIPHSRTVRAPASMASHAGVSIVFFHPFASVAAILVTYWVGWIIYARNFHPLSKVPGPWLASVSRIWYMRQIATGESMYCV